MHLLLVLIIVFELFIWDNYYISFLFNCRPKEPWSLYVSVRLRKVDPGNSNKVFNSLTLALIF
jgi:hypothetical protein